MRGIPLWIGFVVVLGLGTATVVRASDTCVGGCTGDLIGCVQDARNDKLVCRDDCRSNGRGGSCMRDCRVQGATQRKACRTSAKGCVTTCAADAAAVTAATSGGPACQGSCGQALSQCLRDASSGLAPCIDTCPKGSAHDQCVNGCEALVESGANACHDQHRACLAGCAGATTSSTIASSTTTVTSTSTTSSTVGNPCGNGVIDPGEECDTNEFGGATCPGSSTGAFLLCTPECTIDFSQCPGAPTTTSTVPQTTSTTAQSTTTSSTVASTTTSTTINPCGNGILDPGEECDTNEFGGATCPGSSTGAFLACTPACTIDFSGCPGATTTSTIPGTTSSTSTSSTSSTTTSSTVQSTTTSTTINQCGNGILDPGEECDTNEFGGATCPGSSTGAFLVCTPQCTIDFSGCPGVTTTTTIPGTTSSTSTSSTSSTSTSTTVSTTTSSTAQSTTTSLVTTTSTSTSSSSSSSSTTSTVTTTTTSTTMALGTVLSFTTGPAGGTCGGVKSGGAQGSVRKALTCGGLNVGGGTSTVAEGPTPAGAETQMNLSGTPPVLTVSGRTAAQTGSNLHCSDTGCVFGPYLPIANAGTSTCVQNTFSSPASGSLTVATGEFDGSFPLTSAVFLTANATDPCPRCIGGTPGVTGSGTCQAGWTSGVGPSPTEGASCMPTDAAGDTYDCVPPSGAALPSFPVNLTPIRTGTASFSDAGGLFCPSQANAGAFGCAGSGAANPICPGGNTPPVPDYVEEVGSPAGPLDSGPGDGTLASVFCIPSVGGQLGFLINGAANLPGPGATSLPGTLEILP